MTINTSSSFYQAIAIDNRLLDNRYSIELNAIHAMKLNAYEERSARIALDRKYNTVRSALEGLYDLGIQHTCNLRELLENYNIVVGQTL
jgi:hypothetical protein